MDTANSIALPMNRGRILIGYFKMLKTVSTVKATLRSRTPPAPIKALKVTAPRIYGKKYRVEMTKAEIK